MTSNIRVTQDDARENHQISIFQLDALQGRSNKYIPDATVMVDGILHNIELKTSDVKKRQVSTSRNVTLPKLEEYKKVWWIFSQFERTTKGHVFTGEHYFMHGTDLIPWMEKQKRKILEGTPTYGGLNHWNQCLSLLEGKVEAATLARLSNSFNKKGCGLNDPKIGWSDIERYGIKLDPRRLADHLRELISERT